MFFRAGQRQGRHGYEHEGHDVHYARDDGGIRHTVRVHIVRFSIFNSSLGSGLPLRTTVIEFGCFLVFCFLPLLTLDVEEKTDDTKKPAKAETEQKPDKPAKSDKSDRAEKPEKAEKPDCAAKQKSDAPAKQSAKAPAQKPDGVKPAGKKQAVKPAAERATDAQEKPVSKPRALRDEDKAAAAKALEFVKGIVVKMGFDDATVEVGDNPEKINITAPQGDDSLIIGRHGETLSALAYLAETGARAEKCHINVTVDDLPLVFVYNFATQPKAWRLPCVCSVGVFAAQPSG